METSDSVVFWKPFVMSDHMQVLLLGSVIIFNPKKGTGWTESIMAITMLIGILGLVFLKRDVPSWLIACMSMVTSYFFFQAAHNHGKRALKRK